MAPSSLTYLQAYTQVARVLGNENDTDLQSEAQDAIQEAIDDLNAEHDWSFTLTEQNVTLSAGTADYSVGSNKDLKKVENVYLQNNNWSLVYIPEKLWKRIVSDFDQNGPVVGYNLLPVTVGASEEQQIRFRYTPGATDTAVVTYYKLIASPSADADYLQMPQRFQRWVIYQAKAHVLANNSDNEPRLSFWQQKADRQLQRIKWADSHQPDQDETMFPAVVSSAVFPYDHPIAALLRDYGH